MLKVTLGNPKAIEAAIRSVSKFASSERAGLESTSWVHVQSIDNGVRLTATDLLTSVEYAVNSQVKFYYSNIGGVSGFPALLYIGVFSDELRTA